MAAAEDDQQQLHPPPVLVSPKRCKARQEETHSAATAFLSNTKDVKARDRRCFFFPVKTCTLDPSILLSPDSSFPHLWNQSTWPSLSCGNSALQGERRHQEDHLSHFSGEQEGEVFFFCPSVSLPFLFIRQKSQLKFTVALPSHIQAAC